MATEMRIVMMGTGPFAVPTFHWLLDSPHDVAVLVTRPTPAVRTRGRLPPNPMRELAQQRGIQVLAPDDVNASAAEKQLASLRPDLLVVCDYGQILSPATLAVAPLGGINLHGSLLPKYRGAAPVAWAILQGETRTGVSVIHMTPRLDAGPCLVQRATAIGEDETAAELEVRLAGLGVEAVADAIGLLAGWDGSSPLGTPQDASRATRAPRLKKSDGLVDWSRRAAEIRNQVRALQPWPGTFTFWRRGGEKTQRMILNRVTLADAADGAPSGSVIRAAGDQLWIAAGQGAVAVQRMQPAGKRVMETAELLRGYPIRVGDTFGDE